MLQIIYVTRGEVNTKQKQTGNTKLKNIALIFLFTCSYYLTQPHVV